MALGHLASPALEWLLAHGTLSRRAARAYENSLAALFGCGPDAPFGALRLLGEPSNSQDADCREGCWLCADPVHLRFHHEKIILADAGAFELTTDESHALAAGLNREFADIGIFHVAEARRWYVRLHADITYIGAPLSAVAGRRIEGELPEHPQASKLRSWLNEVQMFLHRHPVNAARASAGQPAVNSLWLWGAGFLPLPAGSAAAYDGIWSRAPLALGLGRAAGIPTHALPESLDRLLAHAASGTSHLVFLDDLVGPVLYEDSRAWRDGLERLETVWFQALRPALGRQVDTLNLICPTIYGELEWELKGPDRWKIWRRPQPLANLAKELAQ